MMHARASDVPVEGVSSARGSTQNPADTADVMFNIDNSPERNGLWSFRKILCVFFTISWPCAWIGVIHQFDLMGRYPQSSYRLRWNELCLWKQSRAMRWNVLHRRFMGNQELFLRSLYNRFSFLLCGIKRKCQKPWRCRWCRWSRSWVLSLNCVSVDHTSGFACFSPFNTNQF